MSEGRNRELDNAIAAVLRDFVNKGGGAVETGEIINAFFANLAAVVLCAPDREGRRLRMDMVLAEIGNFIAHVNRNIENPIRGRSTLQ